MNFPGVTHTGSEWASRLTDAVYGTLCHLGLLVARRHFAGPVLLAAALVLPALLLLTVQQRSFPWTATLAAITVPPLLLAFAVRGAPAYHSSRFCYQSFLIVAGVAGSLADWFLKKWNHRSMLLALALTGLAVGMVPYYRIQEQSLLHRLAILRTAPPLTGPFWYGWASFFEQTSARARTSQATFRLPSVRIDPDWQVEEVFATCNPRGMAAVLPLPPRETSTADCHAFWQEAEAIRRRRSPFGAVAPPSSFLILPPGESGPADKSWVCWARKGT